MSLRFFPLRPRSTALALLAAAASACSGGVAGNAGLDSGTGNRLPASPVDPLVACQQLAQAKLALEEKCQRLDARDSATFLAAQCPSPVYGPEEDLFDAGLLAYSLPAVQCAVTSYSMQTCNTQPALNAGCLPLAWGVLGSGQSCDDPQACASGYFCQRPSPLSPCGSCSPVAGMGSACGPTGGYAVCEAGLGCVGECEPIAGQGMACQQNTAVCAQGLSCHPSGCFPPSGPDGGCGDDEDCLDGLTCLNGARCVSAPPDGGDCSLQACAAGLACAAEDAGAFCVPLAARGPCVQADGGPVCPEAESCRAGTCVPLSPLGGSCGVSADCSLGACLAGSCTLVGAAGSCNRNVDCQSQRCDSQVGGSHACGALCAP